MGSTALEKVLITGSGTGFGYEVATRLAETGFDVIAAVETDGQVQTLNRQAAERDAFSSPRTRVRDPHRARCR